MTALTYIYLFGKSPTSSTGFISVSTLLNARLICQGIANSGDLAQQAYDVEMTSQQRHFDFICLLGGQLHRRRKV